MPLMRLTPNIKESIEEFSNTITDFSLAACRLVSLENFPNLPKLKKINLSDNLLRNDDLDKLRIMKDLKYLELGGNRIGNIDFFIECLSDNIGLKMVDLFGNPLCKISSFRGKLFDAFT